MKNKTGKIRNANPLAFDVLGFDNVNKQAQFGAGGMKAGLYRIDQAGTAAPTINAMGTVDFGTITPARTSTGLYTFTLTGIFTADKTFIEIQQDGAATASYSKIEWTSANVLTVRSFNVSDAAADLVGRIYLRITVLP